MTSADRDQNIARQRRFWGERARSWEHNASTNPGLMKVVDEVVRQSGTGSTRAVVDLGAGTGQLALRLAPVSQSVLAVDVSTSMIKMLAEKASAEGLNNVESRVEAIEEMELAPQSVDLVVSNYALHHLRDQDKARLVVSIARWLRPGGRLVIGDMMFGRGGQARDRQIIASKVTVMLKRGPAGWWRIAKNSYRYLLRRQERPISTDKWCQYLTAAGFDSVMTFPVVAEAAVVTGVVPPSSG
ncbi:MAG: class I SAM-dependent methyltransferase [Acidimicrobiales bacterium]